MGGGGSSNKGWALTGWGSNDRIWHPHPGEVAERLNAPVSKTGLPARVAGVRISPSPYELAANCGFAPNHSARNCLTVSGAFVVAGDGGLPALAVSVKGGTPA